MAGRADAIFAMVLLSNEPKYQYMVYTLVYTLQLLPCDPRFEERTEAYVHLMGILILYRVRNYFLTNFSIWKEYDFWSATR